MKRTTRATGAVLLGTLLVASTTGCQDDETTASGRAGAVDAPPPSAPAPHDTVPAPDAGDLARAPSKICDGSSTIRFAQVTAGGGQVLPGSQVLNENGFSFFIIDGSCHYWAKGGQFADVKAGVLTPDEELRLYDDLRVESWPELKETCTGRVMDGASSFFRLGTSRIVVPSGCSGQDSVSPLAEIESAFNAHAASLSGRGTPVDGPVRLVLVAVPVDISWNDLVTNAAAAWPLMRPAAQFATSAEHASQYRAGDSMLVEIPDAGLLRAIRRTFMASGNALYTGGYVPIRDDAGNRYQLFVRDTVPMEDESGLLGPND